MTFYFEDSYYNLRAILGVVNLEGSEKEINYWGEISLLSLKCKKTFFPEKKGKERVKSSAPALYCPNYPFPSWWFDQWPGEGSVMY